MKHKNSLKNSSVTKRLKTTCKGVDKTAKVTGILTTALLALTGCAFAKPSLVSKLPSSESQQELFQEYYQQEINWENCEVGENKDITTTEPSADETELTEILASSTNPAVKQYKPVNSSQLRCASIAAPLDWADPHNNYEISVRIIQIASSGKAGATAPALFFNPGGPGDPALNSALYTAASPEFSEVLQNYSVIGFDPRGIGRSTPLYCNDETGDDYTTQLRDCINSNPIAHTMGTTQVANDMDLIRVLLKNETLNYLGYSYGTMLGATYASLFPDKTGRMLLDSAENSEWASPIHQYEQHVAIDKAKVGLAELCDYLAELPCPFTNYESLNAIYEEISTAKITADLVNGVEPDLLDEFLTDTLYQGEAEQIYRLEILSKLLYGNDNESAASAEEITALLHESTEPVFHEDPVYDDTPDVKAEKAKYKQLDFSIDIVSCHAMPPYFARTRLKEHIKNSPDREKLLGSQNVDELVDSFYDLSCNQLLEKGNDFAGPYRSDTAQTILVTGVTGDHATPYKYAKELVEELGNARLLTLDRRGHALAFSGVSECLDITASKYLTSGELPAEGAVCEN